MKRKIQTILTPKKRRGKRKTACSEYDRTEYHKDYYNKLKNNPERIKKKRLSDKKWNQSENGKKYYQDYYKTKVKEKNQIISDIKQKMKKEQTKKALEYCPVKPGHCDQLKYNEFNEKICHKFNDEIISLWDINHCPAKKESK